MIDYLIFNIPKMDLRAPSIALGLLKATTEADGLSSRCYDLNIDLWRKLQPLGYGHWWSYNDWTWVSEKGIKDNWHILEPHVIECIEENIVKYQPRVVGMSVFSIFQYFPIENISKIIRERLPNTKIHIGGPGVSIRNQVQCEEWFDKLKESNSIDDWMFGESEFILTDYINGKSGPGINNWETDPRTKQLRLIKPNYEDVDFDLYPKKHLQYDNNTPGPNGWVYMTGSRGCVRKCTFCDVESLWPIFKSKTGKFIAEEMIDNYEKYGIDKFRFTDSLLNGNLHILEEKCQTLYKNGYTRSNKKKLEWHGQYICRNKKQQSPEFYDLMSETGLGLVSIGIESGSEKVRYDMKKKFDNDSLRYTLEQCQRVDIKVVPLLMVGYPTETEEDFKETLDLLEYISKLDNIIDINLNNPTRILPGSPLGNDPGHFGVEYSQLISDKDFTASWWYKDNDYATRIERFYRFHHKMIEVGLPKSYAGDDSDKYMQDYIKLRNNPEMVKIMKEVHNHDDIRNLDKETKVSEEVLGPEH